MSASIKVDFVIIGRDDIIVDQIAHYVSLVPCIGEKLIMEHYECMVTGVTHDYTQIASGITNIIVYTKIL